MDAALALRVALVCLFGSAGWSLPTPDNPAAIKSIVNVLLSLAELARRKDELQDLSRSLTDRWSPQQKKGVESFIRFGRTVPRSVPLPAPPPGLLEELIQELEEPKWPSSWRIVWPPQIWKDMTERAANDTFIRFGRQLGQTNMEPSIVKTRETRGGKAATDFLRFG